MLTPEGRETTQVILEGLGAAVVSVVKEASALLTSDAQNKPAEARSSPGQTSSGQATDEHGNKLGPSGKPMRHNVDHSSKKAAKDAARDAGDGPPIHHPSPKVGKPHYHSTDRAGDKKPGVHHNYPE
jgi:hypothetical protein